VEAKGFAYVGVFAGLAEAIGGRWNRAWLWLGAAGALHVVVGGWATIGALLVFAFDRNRPRWLSIVPGLAGGLLLALPGLVPVLFLDLGVDRATARQAAVIYVFERLPHHLVPQRFASADVFGLPVPFVVRHGLLAAVWMALAWFGPKDDRWRRMNRFVVVTIGLTLCGTLLSLLQYLDKELAASLLRFYWFRMSDVFVPAAVAVLMVQRAASGIQARRWVGMVWLTAGLLIAVGHSVDVARRSRAITRPPADAKLADPAAWRELCEWVAQNTPPDAVFLTPRSAQSFHWYAERAEVVNQKDLPQDALHIVEWWARLQDVHRAGTAAYPSPWHTSLTELTAARLRELGRRYGATHVITEAEPPLALERVGPANRAYAVYRLTK
jgi:hypothetical protein